jgi:predicted ATPase/class 3 adenylate cyclase
MLLTFLIADIRGYTRFTAECGDEAAARLASRFAELCEEVVGAHRGEVIELRGDEALCVFTSARDALRAAVALRAVFRDTTERDPSLPLTAGMGLDAGDTVPVGDGYRGGALNLAARLCTIAGPSEILASQTVIGLARKTEGIRFIDRGEVTLKGLAAPVGVIQVAPEGELGESLPPLQAVLSAHPTNLPDEPTPFIGREAEIGRIVAMLGDPHIRLLTLTVPPGTGKTRLALQVGGALLHDFRDGVFFCDLAPLSDPALVPQAIAGVLGVTEEPGRALLTTLTAHLREKHLLLVLDNFEHLLDACDVVSALLTEGRTLTILVTSRIPLHLSREHEYPVTPLLAPDAAHLSATPAELSQYEAVALFLERAGAVRPDFQLTSENAPAVAELCFHLDGLPLAIELAAARTKLFPPQTLLARLSDRFALLTGGAKDRPGRQQTLRHTVDWSYSLLTGEEQMLFARLSAFAGGCSFEAAAAVCEPDGDLDILDGLASLVDKSLLRQAGEDEPRFTMLETIRAYAAEKLDESGEAEAVRARHADVFVAFAEQTGHKLVKAEDRVVALRRFAGEQDNLRAALSWLLEQRDSDRALRLAGATWGFWNERNLYEEGRRWLEGALALSGSAAPALRAAALRGAGALTHLLEDRERGLEYAERSLALYREAGDLAGVALQAMTLAITYQNDGAFEKLLPYLEESEALARRLGDSGLVIQALGMRANLANEHGQEEEAVRLWEEALAGLRREGRAWNLSTVLARLAMYYREHGNYRRAAELATEMLDFSERVGDLADIGHAHGIRGSILVYQGQLDEGRCELRTGLALVRESGHVGNVVNYLEHEIVSAAETEDDTRAACLSGAQEAAYARLGTRIPASLVRLLERHIAPARARLGVTAWETAREAGRDMSLEGAVAYALGEAV